MTYDKSNAKALLTFTVQKFFAYLAEGIQKPRWHSLP